jgi:ABC-type dipeptide/oligopeptide/nickel transport system ATPase subunit
MFKLGGRRSRLNRDLDSFMDGDSSMVNQKSEDAVNPPTTTFERHVHDTLETLSEHLRVQIASYLDSAVRELTAAAEADRARAVELGAQAARAEAERDLSARTARLFAVLEETLSTLKQEIGAAEIRAGSVTTVGSR